MKLLTTLSALVAASLTVAAQDLPSASIANGVVIGTTTSLASATATVNKFLGIPYQQTPPERFGPPSPVSSWQQPLDASKFGDACIQQYISGDTLSGFGFTVAGNVTQSEDCLYLNVWQPGGSPPTGGWPVMFWIYGGAFQFGSADMALYDGSSFASFEDVVFVSFNYRLNAFGFVGGLGLPLNDSNPAFLDQRYALQWVQNNIASFGGDPSKVTILGESAGAFSVDALLTVPPEGPPFRAAILESGTSVGEALSLISSEGNEQSWNALAAGVGCTNSSSSDRIACLRAVPATTIQNFIQNNGSGTVFNPVSDDVTFTTNVTGVRTTGRAANVSLLIGTNADEGTLFTSGQTNLSAYANSLFGSGPVSFIIPQILEQYAVGTPRVANESQAISQLFGDLVFVCPASVVANQSAAAGSPTWRYYYNSTFPNSEPIATLGVYHSSEIALAFGTFNTLFSTAQQSALSQYMRGAWGRFARNPVAGPGWNPTGTFSGTDLGVLGGVEVAGVTVENPQEVDLRCQLFTGLYAFLTS